MKLILELEEPAVIMAVVDALHRIGHSPIPDAAYTGPKPVENPAPETPSVPVRAARGKFAGRTKAGEAEVKAEVVTPPTAAVIATAEAAAAQPDPVAAPAVDEKEVTETDLRTMLTAYVTAFTLEEFKLKLADAKVNRTTELVGAARNAFYKARMAELADIPGTKAKIAARKAKAAG
jgi:hypothetical protein